MQKRVAILVETSRAYGRGLLNGICQYQQRHGKWLTYFQPGGLGDPPPAWLKRWKGDGILARIETPEMADLIKKFDIPVINLRGTDLGLNLPFLGSDNDAIASMAADHLIERGLTHFAFVGEATLNVSFDQRKRHFKRIIEKYGYSCNEIAYNRATDRFTALEKEHKRMASWIMDQPKPLGILAMNDDIGLIVLEACRMVNVNIPDDVAVLGVENDEYLCNLSIPPLSSIDMQSERTGFEAAALLDSMMSGKHPKPPSPIKPRRVVTRHSTDILFVNDPLVAKALRFIQLYACDENCSGMILGHLGVSRTTLGPRFKNAIGRTVHEQIQRVRIQKAIDRIIGTNEPLKYIAIQSGFQTIQYFTRVFRETTGETPASFRESRLRIS